MTRTTIFKITYSGFCLCILMSLSVSLWNGSGSWSVEQAFLLITIIDALLVFIMVEIYKTIWG